MRWIGLDGGISFNHANFKAKGNNIGIRNNKLGKYSISLNLNGSVSISETDVTLYNFFVEDQIGWKSDNAKLYVYTWSGSNNRWIELKYYGNTGNHDIYGFNLPSGYSNFKLVRLNPNVNTDLSNAWDMVYNDTGNLTTSGKNYFKLTSWGSDKTVVSSENVTF